MGLADQADARVPKGRRLFGAVIRGTVIHDQDFNILQALVQDGCERPTDIGPLVEERNDDGRFGHGIRLLSDCAG